MRFTIVKTTKQKKRFLQFRRDLYAQQGRYVDNSYYMLLKIFGEKLHFLKGKSISAVYVEEREEDGKERILCEGLLVWTREYAQALQLCFFEAEPEQEEAVELLLKKAMALVREGRQKGCQRLVIGLNGHVNYGLGLLASHYEEKNSFSSPGNPEYYRAYFQKFGCTEVHLNSYITYSLRGQLKRYRAIINKLENRYTFRTFERKQFLRDAQIYTELNNACFGDHRYYYDRKVIDDMEMLKELFLFMKEDSIIFAFDGKEPVGFIMWYPDFNELASRGEAFGTKHYFRNLVFGKKIRTVKVMEFGVLKEYRGCGLPMALINRVYDIVEKKGFSRVESSWILEENRDSNSFCKAVCDGLYKDYVVYEKEPE